MPYKDQIIHFTGGVNEWVGELDQAEHKMGKGWWRLKNPCRIGIVQEQSGRNGLRIMAIQGNNDAYKKFIDVYVPQDSIIEIKVLDKSGDLFKAYEKEVQRKKSSIIQMPNALGVN